jgi:hypothetical protein
MRKQTKWGAIVLFVAVIGSGVGALLASPPVSAAGSTCWRVDCNVCCRTGHGPVICTQRACV